MQFDYDYDHEQEHEDREIKRVAFREKSAFLIRSYGSSKTQNVEDAIAHTQGIASLAGAADEQMFAMRKQRRLAHRLPVVRLL